MDSFYGLLNNSALMLTLCVIYDTFNLYSIKNKTQRDLVIGILFGVFSIAVMLTPWSLEPGVFFDTRSVLLSLCGLYFGFIPTLVAVLIAGIFRVYQGGTGGIVGTVVIIVTATIGVVWGYFNSKFKKYLTFYHFYIFGVVVQLAMLSCMLLMPQNIRFIILEKITLPIIIIYPILTTIIGLILKRQEDRRIAENELVQNRKKLSRERGLLKSVINSIPHLISFKNNDGTYIGCNDSFEKFIGYKKTNIVGKRSCDFFSKEFSELSENKDKEVFVRNNQISYEHAIDLSDGTKIFLDTIKTPLKDADGTPYGLVSISRNITDRKNAHEAIKESESKFRTIFDCANDAIVIHDPETGAILDVNQRMCEMFGITHKEALEKTIEELSSGIKPYCQEEALKRFKLAASGVPQLFEWQARRKDDVIFWVEISMHRIVMGGLNRILATSRDISERKNAEVERLNLEKQILHAQKLESLGVLAGGIAHDFNNILTSVLGNADLALQRINPESPAVDNLRCIEKSAVRAAELAKQMLAYSGKGTFVIRPHDINSLIEEMLHMLQVSISKKAVLRLNLTPNLPPVEADATQLRQIIMNLVVNASEAIGDKSGVIAISTGCMDCDSSYLNDVWLKENLSVGLYVFVEIADTGCGMSKDVVAKLFDPFFTTKFTGRGLGMAAVLGIVRGHQGAIKVYSEPGKGSTFKILLPASCKPIEIFNHDNSDDNWIGHGTVLFVDDEETVRGIGTEMLKLLGFNVVTASDGREAVSIYKEKPDFQLVVLDLTMPHLDGEQCFRELRKINPNVKVILSSGFSESEVTQKFAGKGLVGFIQKPYKLSTLRETIRAVSSF